MERPHYFLKTRHSIGLDARALLIPVGGVYVTYVAQQAPRPFTPQTDVVELLFLTQAQEAYRGIHPAMDMPKIHATLRFALWFGESLGAELLDWRHRVLHDIRSLSRRYEKEQVAWFDSLPEWLRWFYGSPDSCRQIPLMRHIASVIGYPFKQLEEDFLRGFKLLGDIPSEGLWRNENGKQATNSLPDLVAFAKTHLVHLVQRKPCKHWQQLHDKLQEEITEHKVIGPLRPPADPAGTVASLRLRGTWATNA